MQKFMDGVIYFYGFLVTIFLIMYLEANSISTTQDLENIRTLPT